MNWIIQAYITPDGLYKVIRQKDGSWTMVTQYIVQPNYDIESSGIAAAEDLAAQAIPSVLNLEVNGVFLGVYDYNKTFTHANTITYEACWTYYNTFTAGSVATLLNTILTRNRTPVLVIEPWNIPAIGSAATLLPDIAAGKYDAILRSIGTDIGVYGGPAVIRWGPKMDIVGSTYPWAGQPPAQYIAAFQHVVTFLRTMLSATSVFNQYMWSPSVDDTTTAPTYYPGPDVVDIVGISLYEFPPYSIGTFNSPRTCSQWLDQKYPVISGFGKPVFIADGGDATVDNQASWVSSAFSTFGNYPLLAAFIWTNGPASTAWGSYGTPDFSISPAIWTAG